MLVSSGTIGKHERHSLASLFIYAGQDIKEGYYKNLWKLNLNEADQGNMHDLEQFKKLQWVAVPTTGDVPPAYSHHTCVVHADTMYLYGGVRGEQNNPDFYKLDLNKLTWTLIQAEVS